MRKRVLITGATGDIGRLLAERLSDDYELVKLGLPIRDAKLPGDVAPIGLDDFEGLREQMEGVDTVIHLAGQRAPDASWDDLLGPNIVGVRNVLEAARQTGVRRVIFASTNHVTGMRDRHREWPHDPANPSRPDSLYGVTKAFGETLGRLYFDEYGLEFVALRIGWMTEDPLHAHHELLLSMWLSPGDCTRMIRAAIESDVGYGIYYAMSNNPDAPWDMTNARDELGFVPQDSWTQLPGGDTHRVDPYVGGWPN